MSQSSLRKLAFTFPTSKSPERFTIKVDQDLLDFAKERARTYRSTPGISSEWSLEGPPQDQMSALAKHWAKEYDWSAVQDKINRDFEHYATTVPGIGDYKPDIPLHFIHRRSPDEKAIPLLLLHGWPSSNLLWENIIEPLSDAFHIVAPDLPGYGFSPAPAAAGLDPKVMGKAFDAVMKQLGYDKYGLVSTDLGAIVALHMTQALGDSIIGHFTDFLLLNPTPDDQERMAKNETTEEENEYIKAMNTWNTQHFAYAPMHATKPLLLSHSFADSPVGHAGWVWDLMHTASDGYEYSFDDIITKSLALWIQEPYAGLRAYTETLKAGVFDSLSRTEIPTGVVQFGSENGPFPALKKYILAPESWTGRLVNAVYFKRHDYGGHFPTISHPQLYIQHVREFFSLLSTETPSGAT
ncbi:hypothetical protein NW762_010787 [Fusarium torreyae]|uniref:Epoxide hydrolase N-terminal domain-containing protein n=1 Tax=Fusarium torreyae TaxID=1237075 RepID=A0A9W8RQY6_9HYPO|nr:hypothetical protein NW762_010787 [Fusarium torreyae]